VIPVRPREPDPGRDFGAGEAGSGPRFRDLGP
jgi:hypothetical protein